MVFLSVWKAGGNQLFYAIILIFVISRYQILISGYSWYTPGIEELCYKSVLRPGLSPSLVFLQDRCHLFIFFSLLAFCAPPQGVTSSSKQIVSGNYCGREINDFWLLHKTRKIVQLCWKFEDYKPQSPLAICNLETGKTLRISPFNFRTFAGLHCNLTICS